MTEGFQIKSISQSNPVVNGANKITVTLQSNQTLPGNSTITISGLSSAIVSSPVALNPVSGGNNGESIFQSGTVISAATFTSGTLLLSISSNQYMNESIAYAFSFMITNPSTVPVAPSISIEFGGISAAMDLPNTALIGVANGGNPLVRDSS